MVAPCVPSASEDRNGSARQLEQQRARLLDIYLAEIITREEFERKYHALTGQQEGLRQQQRQLEAQTQQQLDTVKLTQHMTSFCERLVPVLDQLNFAQRRQLVELLVDCVIVSDEQVEIRYVIPTGPQGEAVPFRHLRSDYLDRLVRRKLLREPAPLAPAAQDVEDGRRVWRLCPEPLGASDHRDRGFILSVLKSESYSKSMSCSNP
jgi:hypothetical protein